jgi:hypothetical protein
MGGIMKLTRMSPEGWTTKLSEILDEDRLKFCFLTALASGVKINVIEKMFEKKDASAAPDDYDDDEAEGMVRLSHEGTGAVKSMTPDEFLAMTIGEYILLCQFLAGDDEGTSP